MISYKVMVSQVTHNKQGTSVFFVWDIQLQSWRLENYLTSRVNVQLICYIYASVFKMKDDAKTHIYHQILFNTTKEAAADWSTEDVEKGARLSKNLPNVARVVLSLSCQHCVTVAFLGKEKRQEAAVRRELKESEI